MKWDIWAWIVDGNRMIVDVERKIQTCPRCECHKSLPEHAAPLVNIQVTRPLKLVCMDFLSIEPDSRKSKDVLVITDFFTKYAVAVPTSNQNSRTVAKALWVNFIVNFITGSLKNCTAIRVLTLSQRL